MPLRPLTRSIAAFVVPPLCAICAAPCATGSAVCARCRRGLERARPGARAVPGVGLVIWAAPHDGLARELVGALKFGGRTALASLAAERMAAALVDHRLAPALVPVPPAPARLRRRGFDPTGLMAAALAERLERPLVECVARLDSGRQVGRPRQARIADPPRIACPGDPPSQALLVDDVLTTGASLRVCAAALRSRGCPVVGAAVFAAALGARAGAA